jgi:hypothetical protein
VTNVQNAGAADPTTPKSLDGAIRLALLLGAVAFVVGAALLIVFGNTAGLTRVTTTVAKHHTTVLTRPGHAARGSATLDNFLLGLGVILALTAAFYDRIKSIKLPGGGEIDLTPAAGALLAAHVKAQVGNDPHTFEQAYRKALSSLGNDYWGKVASPPDAALAQAAAIAKRDLTAPEGSG